MVTSSVAIYGVMSPKPDPEKRLAELLDRVWCQAVSVKSNYARDHADVVAMAASLHMITTKTGVSTFASAWNITNTGLTWLNEREHD